MRNWLGRVRGATSSPAVARLSEALGGWGRFRSIFVVSLLVAIAAPSRASDEVMPAASAQSVSIQIVNPDLQTRIRVLLDDTVIFDAVPLRSAVDNVPTIPAVAGAFRLSPGSKHKLMAEVAGGATRAQLQWTQIVRGSSWIVLHYYPGRKDSDIPPFFTFALQDVPHKLR